MQAMLNLIAAKAAREKKLKFTSDIEEIEYSFWVMIHKLAKKIKNKEPLVKEDFCDSAVLNVKINNINTKKRFY